MPARAVLALITIVALVAVTPDLHFTDVLPLLLLLAAVPAFAAAR